MTTWGPGNFQNDDVLEYVYDIANGMKKVIEDCLADEKRASLDEDGEAVLMPSVVILSVLCEHCKAAPPEEKIVREWQEKYLRIYDEQIDGFEPQRAYKIERRKVIEETFEKLAFMAYSWENL